jgi:sigma-B regulation protein RsbU (phosphoserine phosphatase)
MKPNAPIGVLPGLEFIGEEIESIKGRPLFIYTDGLNEAENPALEQYGDDRLLEFLRNCSYESAQQVIETITADIERHRDGAEPNDDLTMMILKLS